MATPLGEIQLSEIRVLDELWHVGDILRQTVSGDFCLGTVDYLTPTNAGDLWVVNSIKHCNTQSYGFWFEQIDLRHFSGKICAFTNVAQHYFKLYREQ